MAELTRLESRYLFTGELTLLTALHIGGGEALLGTTNSPVLRLPDGQPFIPGSSLKGAFRSTVEKLEATLALPHMERDVLDPSSPWMRRFIERRDAEKWDETHLVAAIQAEWPVTAQLFGTPYSASRIFFTDAYLLNDQEGLVQRRDGVPIDRDSERAMDHLKYDYEVVPPSLRFRFEVRLDTPTPTDLSLACIGMVELQSGWFSLGGKRSSGLGRCQLAALHIYELDLRTADIAARARILQQYLLGKSLQDKFAAGQLADPQAFLEHHIQRLVQEEVGHAETPRQ